MARIIFHLDMDAFFASIEQRDYPAYRGKPLIVGAKPGARGVVSAASYEARRFGVHSAMPISEAVRRCPSGIFVRPRMEVYSRDSDAVMEILGLFSPAVEQVSIDEAFIDMTGTEKLLGKPADVAQRMKEKIANELKLGASIGIAPNKFLAKIASDMNKPNGLTVAPFKPEAILAWLAPMPVIKIWGIGKKTNAVLAGMGITSVADLQMLPKRVLADRFGTPGEELYALCRGIDDRPVETGGEVKSISREHTFNQDSMDREEWKSVLFSLSQDVARQARRSRMKGATVVLIYRKSDFSKHTKRKPLAYPVNVAQFIYEGALKLLDEMEKQALRLIGVGLTGFDRETQTNLFAAEPRTRALEVAEAAMDRIAARFGEESIAKGRDLVHASEQKKRRSRNV